MRAALLAAGLIVVTAPPAGAAGRGAPLIPRELDSLGRSPGTLVQLRRGAGREALRQVRAAGGVPVSRGLRLWHVPSTRARLLVPRLALAGALAEFEPERPRSRAGTGPGADPLLVEQHWLARVGADRVEPPGPGVPVTVIDSGLDLEHPEFAGRPDTQALNAQTVAGGREFHGTAVASILAAPSNGLGVVGIYPRARLRSWDASPSGLFSSRDVIEGIDAASALGTGVINLSLGGRSRSRFEEEAILLAVARGSLVVAAAGNDGRNGNPRNFPADLPHVLTVASTDPLDRVSGFSTRDAGTDLAAPGEEIPVAVPLSYAPDGYVSANGTSFSAPIVAGAAAWVWTQRQQLDATQVAELLRRSARDLGPSGRDPASGFGLLDLPHALSAPAPPADPLEPNDDIDHVRPGGLLEPGRQPLTAPASLVAAISARLDTVEDPRDAYRVYVPPGRRVDASLRSRGDLVLELWRPETPSLDVQGSVRTRHRIAVSARRGSALDQVWVRNPASVGVYVYVSVRIRPAAPAGPAGAASYTLALSTRR